MTTPLTESLGALDDMTASLGARGAELRDILAVFDPVTGEFSTPDSTPDAASAYVRITGLSGMQMGCTLGQLAPTVAAAVVRELVRVRFAELAADIRKNQELGAAVLAELDTAVEALAP